VQQKFLKLVHTPGGDVVIEPMGETITKSKILIENL